MATGVEIANAYVALQVRMPNAAREINAELRKADTGGESIGRRIGGSLMSGLGAVLKGSAVVVGTAVAATLAVSIGKGFQRLDAIDTARAKLTGLGNDAATVSTVMDNALGAVRGTAFGLGDAATVAAQLVAAQIQPGEQLSGVLKSVTNSAAAAGVGMGEMGSIYAKVASVGKAQNDSLQQVAERGIPIYQALATQLGVSTDEIFKMASEGQINFEQFSTAMTAAAGTVADEVGGTVKGTWANFIASLGRVGAGLMSGLYPKIAPFLKALTTALGPLETIAAQVGESLGKWIGPWIDKLTVWVSTIDFTRVVDGIREFYLGAVDVKDLLLTGFTENETLLPPGVVQGLVFAHGIFAAIGDAVRSMFEGFQGRSEFDGVSTSVSSIGSSLQTLQPALASFGAQLPKVGEAAATITAGGLDVLTQVLSFLADHVDTIIAFMPVIVAGFLAWRVASAAVANATLALRAGELAATPVYLANNIMRNNSVRIERQIALAKVASTGAQNASTAATARGTIATFAASTASRVAAAGQWLLNAALTANPIGIIIVAITALVGALIWFFTQTELGQQIWSNVMGAIGVAATWLWENVLSPVFTAIGAVFSWLWQYIILPIGTLIVNYFRFWAAIAVWLWENVLSPVFAGIGQVFSWIWSTIIEPIVGFIVLALKGWGIILDWLWKNVVEPVFAGIGKVMGDTWTWIDQNVFAPFRSGIDLLVQGFQVGASAIGTAWDAIKRAAAVPINFVLDTIWNNGLRSFWNDLVGNLGLADMKLPKANLVAFANGSENHVAQIAGAGSMRLWAEPETGGEAYIPLSPAKRARSTAILADVAKRFGLGLTAYANGGIGDGLGDFVGDVWDNVQKAASVAWEFLSNPAAAIQKHVVDGIIRPMLGGKNIFAQTVGGLATNTVKSMADLFASAAPSVTGGKGMGWERMWDIVRGRFPDATLNSAYRAGAVTVNGSPSYHGLGRAIDLPPRMDIFNWLKAAFPGSSELIYSPAGGRQLLNGREHMWEGAVRAQHFNHVHWAMANGGVLPKLYDQGGWIPDGGVAVNLSGRPEAVLSPAESEAFTRGRGDGAAVVVHGDLITQDVPDLFRKAEKARRRRVASTGALRRVR